MLGPSSYRVPIHFAAAPSDDAPSSPSGRTSTSSAPQPLRLVTADEQEPAVSPDAAPADDVPRASEPAAPPAAAPPAPVPRASDPVAAQDLRAELERRVRREAQLLADFENHKRHAAERYARAKGEGIAETLVELGEVLRGLELALEQAGDADHKNGLHAGVAQVLRALERIFEGHGVQRISSVGHPFDPHLHEAVLVERETLIAAGTIVRELAPGFRTDERVVLPAKVSVAG